MDLRAGQMLEAMLLAPMLRPIVAGNEMLGDYELDLLAQSITAQDTGGFAALVAADLQGAR